jgi:uncharacterized membrane protein
MASDNTPQFDAGDSETSTYGEVPRTVHGEQRLPVTFTVLVVMTIPFLLPDRLSPGPKWILPLLVGLLLVATTVADPGRIDKRSRALRLMSIVIVVALVIEASWATTHLLVELVHGSPVTLSADVLLETGGLVWIGNNVVFALLYWELDGGGPAQRAHQAPKYPDLAFPGQLNPDIVPPNWRPVFVDYLYLGLTNALAFSPTDVMPLAHWSKLTMALQSIISVVILSLVIARAINILTSSLREGGSLLSGHG